MEVSSSEQSFKIKTFKLNFRGWPMRPAVPSKPENKTVLCIDDNPDVLDCEKAFLESFGYTVLTAASGGEGLQLASTHSVDVVIVDYFMPEMNGHEVAIEMRRMQPLVPIIILSAAVDVPPQALQFADAFIAKAHLASQLLPAIEQ